MHAGHLLLAGRSLRLVPRPVYQSLEADVVESLEMSPSSTAASPVGQLSEASSRRTLIHLILTLNHMYPDYDFTTLRARHFSKEPSAQVVRANVDSRLLELRERWVEAMGPGTPDLSSSVWTAIDEAINVADCDIYSYDADQEDAEMDGPFSDSHAVWSFAYFFYNRALKRVCFFSVYMAPRRADEDRDIDEGEQVAYAAVGMDDDVFGDMDL